MKAQNRKIKKIGGNMSFPVLILIFAVIVFLTILLTLLTAFGFAYLLIRTNVITGLGEIPISLIAFFIIVSLIIGTVFSIILSIVPLKPLNELLNAIDSVTEGNYNISLTPRGPEAFRRVHKKFNKMVQELNYEEMLSNDFVNNFSHEFKTPIVSISGFANMLKKDDLTNEERNEYLDIIIEESKRLTDLSENVLELSRLENQTILTDKEEYNISEQLRLVIAIMYGRYPEKNIEFSFDCDEYFIKANEELLREVWINLLDNAMKFSFENGVIDVIVKKKSNKIAVSISNTSETISPENLKRIFNKFYQCDTSHTTKGNGLGLTIVKRIVELHNGEINIKSENNRTTIDVILPES